MDWTITEQTNDSVIKAAEVNFDANNKVLSVDTASKEGISKLLLTIYEIFNPEIKSTFTITIEVYCKLSSLPLT